MICPLCAFKDNLPGAEECGWCQFSLASIDVPVPFDRVDRSLMADPVQVLRPRPPVTVLNDARLGQAMSLMLEHRVGAVLVTDASGLLRGILTERDFLTKVAGHPEAAQLSVEPWMTVAPESVRLDDPLALALGKMMAGGYRHLPVLDNNRPLGVISVRDILRHIIHLCQESS